VTNAQFGEVNVPGAALNTEVLGINSRGVVVGDYLDADTKHRHGFMVKDGSFQAIDVPQAADTSAIGINEAGEIVGYYATPSGDQHGFLLDQKGFTSIDYPSAASTIASVINDSGKIGGTYVDAAGQGHGFVLNMETFNGAPNPVAPIVIPIPYPVPTAPITGAPTVVATAPSPVVSTPTPSPIPIQTPPSQSPSPSPTPSPTPVPTPVPTPPPPQNGSSALPTPPASAQVFPEVEQRAGWQACNSPGCAGGSGTGSYWHAQNQTVPSLSGSSLEIYNSGIGADTLWWQKLGANNSATNFLWDFYAQVDGTSVTAAQALEYDSFQFVGGYNYMFGSQCNLAAGKWDVWDELNGRWVHTTIPCKQFDPDVWHHIQWYVQRIDGTQNYTFVTLVVDGVAYAVNQTYSAKYVGWKDDLGVQYQLDVNATGAGYREWIDRSSLTVW